jgi:hypothetical protein
MLLLVAAGAALQLLLVCALTSMRSLLAEEANNHQRHNAQEAVRDVFRRSVKV